MWIDTVKSGNKPLTGGIQLGILAQPAAVLLGTALSIGHFGNGALNKVVPRSWGWIHSQAWRQENIKHDPQEREVNPLLPKELTRVVSGEAYQIRNIASNPAVAGLGLTVSHTQCKGQTDKVHPCRSPPAASGTSQGTHPAIYPT